MVDYFNIVNRVKPTLQKMARPLDPYVAPIGRLWRGLPPFAQHLLKSLAIGLGAAIFLTVARPYLPAFNLAETAATDWAISFWKDRPAESLASVERFVFVDIDEQAYQRWNGPLFVPRDKLLRLIQFVTEARAKLLVVDIELTKYIGPLQKDPLHSGDRNALSDPDAALSAYLAAYSQKVHVDSAPIDAVRASVTPIIFVRTMGPPWSNKMSDGGSVQPAGQGEGPGLFYEERPSEFLEGAVKPSTVLHWASSLIQRDEDGVLRSWRLYEPTCVGQEPNVVPSVALLAWALIRQPRLDGEPFSAQRFHAELRRRFSPSAGHCVSEGRATALSINRRAPHVWRLDDPILPRPVVVSPHPTDLEQRIFYKFYPGSVQADYFSQIQASLITDPQPDRLLSSDWLAGKIVVIGSSYATAGDSHATPLGEMSGALIVINEINALLEYGQILELDAGMRWAILVAMVAAFSLSFSYFTKSWGTRVARFVVNVLLVPVSLWLFQYGWWLDVVFPLLVLQAYGRFIDFNVESPKIKREYIRPGTLP
ncbi:MAG: CHASE2 domain-containing protein [Nitrospirota bacterium]|nr:CHASE2 domain-containing protein [Nitrospirota bacterium]